MYVCIIDSPLKIEALSFCLHIAKVTRKVC